MAETPQPLRIMEAERDQAEAQRDAIRDELLRADAEADRLRAEINALRWCHHMHVGRAPSSEELAIAWSLGEYELA